MSVAHRGLDIVVSHYSLHDSNICAICYHQSRRRMSTEYMKVAWAGHFGMFFYVKEDFMKTNSIPAISIVRVEKILFAVYGNGWPYFQISAKSLGALRRDAHNTFS
jgi:hypothetical protein